MKTEERQKAIAEIVIAAEQTHALAARDGETSRDDARCYELDRRIRNHFANATDEHIHDIGILVLLATDPDSTKSSGGLLSDPTGELH